MPRVLVETIDGQHRCLLQALERLEELAVASPAGDELTGAIETVRRKLLAHELTAERFVIAPLRRLHLLRDGELDALGAELDRLSREAVRLEDGEPDAEAVAAFIRDAREHIERKTRAVAPTARAAALAGRLAAVPRWYVEEVYGPGGGAGGHPPEEWLG